MRYIKRQVESVSRISVTNEHDMYLHTWLHQSESEMKRKETDLLENKFCGQNMIINTYLYGSSHVLE